MTIKEQIDEVAKSLPANASIDDMRYKLMVIDSVNKGLKETRSGKGISHGKACDLLGRKWNLK